MDWTETILHLRDNGYRLPTAGISVKIPQASDVLVDCYTACLKTIDEQFVYINEIQQVAEWLTDNRRKGLLLYGKCGRGKTFMARHVLPLILYRFTGLVPQYFDMTYAVRHTDEVLSNAIIILDDVGTEDKYVEYGTTRHTFAEIVDAAEKDGKLLIITSNLTRDELLQRYGERTFDRLVKLVRRVLFTGKSLRQ